MQKRTQSAFTLVELLVVISIIGILSAIVLASVAKAKSQSRDGKRITDVKQLQLAIGLYYDANNKYPANITSSTLAPAYISVVPIDPSSAPGNLIAYDFVPYCAAGDTVNPVGYHMGTSLENSGNSALLNTSSVTNFAGGTYVACTGAGGSSTDLNGTNTAKCLTSDVGSYCYDVTP